MLIGFVSLTGKVQPSQISFCLVAWPNSLLVLENLKILESFASKTQGALREINFVISRDFSIEGCHSMLSDFY